MALKKFAHGGDVQSFAKKLQCDAKEIIDLSSNINFIKPLLNINFNALDISAYPNYDGLYAAIATNYAIQKEQLELFNGGSSGIFSLFQYLHLNSCTIYAPAYLEYKKAALQFGYKLHMINRLENIKQSPTPHSLVVFVNPSTPDGVFYDIKKLLETWDKLQCTVLIDESFLEFTDGQSVIKYLNTYPNLYILKSMTKFYSSAGIRIGAIISNKDNIKKLNSFEPAWKISQFDATYIQDVLKDTEFKQETKKQNVINKEILFSILLNCPLFESVYPSSANYILAKLKDITAGEFQEKLNPYKIMIRDCSNFDFLDESYIRIAVKSKEEITTFQKVLDQISKYYQE